jgi:hypothetical protein
LQASFGRRRACSKAKATRGYALPNYYALDARRIAIAGNFAALFQ